MQWYLEVLKKYATFSGRARRKEYWMFALISGIISLLLLGVDNLLGLPFGLQAIYSLLVLIPGLAVCVRRLHDIGRSAWWLLIVLFPLIGAIVLLVFACLDSQEGTNKYGPNPKAA